MAQNALYYFGRLNLIPAHPEPEEKRQYLDGLLRATALKAHRQHHWSLLEISEISSEWGPVFIGYLVKFKPDKEMEVASMGDRVISLEHLANAVVAKARFFLEVHSGMIASHPSGTDIPRRTFGLRFAELLEAAAGNFFVQAEIQDIEETGSFVQALKEFEVISKIELVLHPSNPNTSRIWKDVDERLKRLGAATYKETVEAPSSRDGLNKNLDEELTNKIAMASDGYGKATVTGQSNNQYRKVSTSSEPLSASVPAGEPTDGVIPPSIREAFHRIFDRFNQKS